MRFPDEDNQGPVIRDRRRIDPVTGQVRGPGGAGHSDRGGARNGLGQSGPARSGPAGARADAPADRGTPEPGNELAAKLAERTADLQRIQAEYANYRKRVERDRMAVREQALANVLSQLLPVLDDIGRAREHGELVGGFKQVAEALEAATTKLGLTSYGENGDPFDPTRHEALMHSYSAEVSEPTCVVILQPGYKVGERILRPARVSVAEPDSGAAGDGEVADGEVAEGELADAGQDATHQERDSDD
jgi:molecular chaperone GrpE